MELGKNWLDCPLDEALETFDTHIKARAFEAQETARTAEMALDGWLSLSPTAQRQLILGMQGMSKALKEDAE